MIKIIPLTMMIGIMNRMEMMLMMHHMVMMNNPRARNNSQICAGQGDLSNPLLAGRDQLLEGKNI